jgi:hypothetical protein
MKITFGDTDGECEAKLARQLVGYTLKVTTEEGTFDVSLVGADDIGMHGAVTDDDGTETGEAFVADWSQIEEIHIY